MSSIMRSAKLKTFRFLAVSCLMLSLSARAEAMQVTRPLNSVWPLGSGYSSTDGTLRPPCVTGTISYSGTPESKIDMGTALSADQLRAEMNAKGEGSVNLVVLGGSVSVSSNILSVNTNTRHSGSYRYGVDGKPATLTNLELTPYGKSALTWNDPATFRELCGDSFLSTAYLGGKVFLNWSLDFKSAKSRAEIITRVEVRVLFYTETHEERSVIESINENAAVNLELYQIGGRPGQLTNIKQQIASCTLESFDYCKAPMQAMLDYVVKPGGFVEQLSNLTYDMKAPEKASVLGFDLGSYKITGLLPSDWVIEAILDRPSAKQIALKEILYTGLSLRKRAYLLVMSSNLAADRIAAVKQFDARLERELGTLSDALETCKSTGKCPPTQALETRLADLYGKQAVLELGANETFILK